MKMHKFPVEDALLYGDYDNTGNGSVHPPSNHIVIGRRREIESNNGNAGKPHKKKKEKHREEPSSSPPSSTSKKCANCCKKTFAFLVSHIGLCSLVVGYSIAGGFIFKELEAPFEVKQRNNVAAKRKYFVEKLWNVTEELNILYKENWTLTAEEMLTDFQMEVYRATKEKGWDGKDGDTDLQWSFSGALLYSVTVITTIGNVSFISAPPRSIEIKCIYNLVLV